ncbi:cation:proton antiporter [Marinilabiliaceae bacterium ANBcel2]|nr:cation:proton antiporter [Marinilabiliaceae bacterium ANBcel2]
MLVNLALIIIAGLSLYFVFSKLKLPGFLGVLLLGVLFGPYGLDIIHKSISDISEELRTFALIIILLRAGLGIQRETLKFIGVPALKLGVVPALFEGVIILAVAVLMLNFSVLEAGMLGFIIAAVSPAVVVPKMLWFIERGIGKSKEIPTMILAAASLDDIIAITIFSTFTGIYAGQSVNLFMQAASIPIAVFSGVIAGILSAIILLLIFKYFFIRHTKKVLLILSFSILLTYLEDIFKDKFHFASLLGVMVIGIVILEKNKQLAKELSSKYNKIWVFAEIMLFFLIGAEVNIFLIKDAGLTGLLIIIIGLAARSLGVALSLAGSTLNLKEKLFCVTSYWPKATVQAAIGAVPLALGVPAGDIILAFAVLSIVVTAPIGAISIDITGKFLNRKSD